MRPGRRLVTLLHQRVGSVLLPEMLRTADDIVIEDYEDYSIFTVIGTASDNSVAYTEGTQSVKNISAVNTLGRLERSHPLDLSAMSGMKIDLYRESATNAGVWFYIFEDGASYFQENAGAFVHEVGVWVTRLLNRSQFTNVGSANWDLITKVRAQIVGVADEQTEYSFDDFRIATTYPVVLIQFDDADDSVYDSAFQYMNQKKVPGTFYVITDSIGGAGAVTSAELVEMDAAGWDIGNHTDDHTNLTTVNQATAETHLSNAKTALDGWGLTRASSHVAYPYGERNSTSDAAMTAQSMLTGRSSSAEAFAAPLLNWYDIPYYPISLSDSLQDLKDLIDDTKAYGTSRCLVVHNIPGSITQVNFEALIDYIVAQKVLPITISQLHAIRSGPLKVNTPW